MKVPEDFEFCHYMVTNEHLDRTLGLIGRSGLELIGPPVKDCLVWLLRVRCSESRLEEALREEVARLTDKRNVE